MESTPAGTWGNAIGHAPHTDFVTALVIEACRAEALESDGDRPDWSYKAEGGANVAFAYVGHRQPRLTGHLLRLRKCNPKTSSAPRDAAAKALELLPHDPLDFATKIMRPLVGHQYVVPGTRVLLPRTILQGFQKALLRLTESGARPGHRSADRLDVDCGFGVLMLDHSMVPSSTSSSSPTSPRGICDSDSIDLCVEIKPKAGVLPPTATRSSDSSSSGCSAGALPAESESLSRSPQPTCRYCQHQILKALEASGSAESAPVSGSLVTELASTLSHYCPLDLYSGEPLRVLRALRALVCCPQNNFRLFAGGQPVFTHETAANYRSRSRASRCETSRSEASHGAPFAGAAAGAGASARSGSHGGGEWSESSESCESWSPEACVAHLEEVLERILPPAYAPHLPSGLALATGPASGLVSKIDSSTSSCSVTSPGSSEDGSHGLHGESTSLPLALPRHCSLIVRVLAAILCKDGLLRSLAAAQSLDDCGADAAHAAFQRAAAIAAIAAAAAADAPTPHAGGSDGPASAASCTAGAVGLSAVPAKATDAKATAEAVERACATAVAAAEAGGGEALDATQRELAAAGRLLSRFMLAASAKDCSILIAFRLRLPADGSAAGIGGPQAVGGAVVPSAAAESAVASGPGVDVSGSAGSSASLLGDDHPGRNSGSVTIELGGASAATAEPGGAAAHGTAVAVSASYSLAVVDLDPKPLARVPQYAALDRRIRDAFALHGDAIFKAAGKTCGAWDAASGV